MCNSRKTLSVTHHGRARSRIDELKAPNVEMAFEDGLLPISALVSPVVVNLEVWDDALLADTYQLLWDNLPIGPAKPITAEHQPGDLLTLEIPIEALTEGHHRVAYQVKNPVNGSRFDSAFMPIEVDITAPGSPELAAISFPAVALDGLTLAELDELGGTLEGDIASYSGMALKDTIQTYWGDVEGPSTEVDGDDMGLRKVVIPFSRDFLIGLGDVENDVTYHVIDRAGNKSIISNPIKFKLRLQEIPNDFPAPVVDPAVGELIDYAEARAGVAIDIPRYTGAAANDYVTLFFGADNPLTAVQLNPGDELQDPVLTIHVPYDVISLLPDGMMSLKYEVTHQSEIAGRSKATDIELFLARPGPTEPDALIIRGTSQDNPNTMDNFIDEDDFELNARAIIPWETGYSVSDTLTLQWGQQVVTNWYQIRATDISAGIDLNLPVLNAIMAAQGTGTGIPVHYSVSREGNPNSSISASRGVTVRSKNELPGGEAGLPAPVFTNLTEGGVIGPIENPNGAPVFISPYINIEKDQKVTLTFTGFDSDGSPIDSAHYTASRELDSNDVNNGYIFTVPAAMLRAICRGLAEAYFRVDPADGANQSPATSLIAAAPVDMHQPVGDCRVP
jgi:hypothetical protein